MWSKRTRPSRISDKTSILTNDELANIKAKSDYGRLCARNPDASEGNVEFSRQDNFVESRMQGPLVWVPTSWSHYPNPLETPLRLLHIPMRNMWLDVLKKTIDEYPYARASDCIVEGHYDLLLHLSQNGFVDLSKIQVVFIGESIDRGCFELSMDVAAMKGHFDILLLLYSAGCNAMSTWAMDWAAANGHILIVKWLHRVSTVGCTVEAIDGAAATGQYKIIKWLIENRDEGFTIDAIRYTTSHKIAKLLADSMSVAEIRDMLEVAFRKKWTGIGFAVLGEKMLELTNRAGYGDSSRGSVLRDHTLVSPPSPRRSLEPVSPSRRSQRTSPALSHVNASLPGEADVSQETAMVEPPSPPTQVSLISMRKETSSRLESHLLGRILFGSEKKWPETMDMSGIDTE